MKNKVFKTLLALSLVSMMSVSSLFSGPLTVNAASMSTASGVVNFGRGNAQITITGNDGQTLVGKKFNIYKLFIAENSVAGESINYTYNPEFKTALQNVVGKKLSKTPSAVTEYEVIDYIQSLNTNPVEGVHTEQTLEGSYSSFRYFVEALRNEIAALGISGDTVNVTTTKADNSIVVDGLDFGYYVIDEVTQVSETHSAASLCIVDTANPDAEVHVKSDYPSVTKKIEEDDNGIGWNDIADFEIGQTVPYKFTSNVPNMNGYDKYYYAWHDVMDKALTFNPSSVSIAINQKNPAKSYTLKTQEFSVIENPGNNETFLIEINDMKAIVDREFNQMNALNENIYGQEVVLTYNATLNDNAALDTGRPGFENDVRLEFSNDPDSTGVGSTGYTPWDTVVAFTYKMNVLKTNNHDLKLADAKFRLYSDEACLQEVFVKKTEQGYNVINRDSAGGTDHTGGQMPEKAVEMVSDADGGIVINGLDDGTYWLKETDAPAGYRQILDPIKITVDATFTSDRDSYVKGDGATNKTLVSLAASAHIKTFLSGVFNEEDLDLDTNVDKGELNINVINEVGKKLPVTGTPALVALYVAGIGMMAAVVVKSRKKEDTI